MIIERGITYTIDYTKENGEKSTRKILALENIPKNITTLDVSDLNPLQQVLLQNKYNEYVQYVTDYCKNIFKFEDWYSHTTEGILDKNMLKYRKFIVNNISKIEDASIDIVKKLKDHLEKEAEKIE